MNEGKKAAWDKFAQQASCAVGQETTLILHMGNGAFDILGTAREAHPEGETTVRALFDAKERDAAKFGALDLEDDFVHPAFRLVVVSEFLEEDIEAFFEWGPFPLESCRLLVVNTK